MDWIEGGALIANPPWEDDTRTGAYGAGSLATAEHGKIWLEAAIAEKVGHVLEIQAQHARRQARRSSLKPLDHGRFTAFTTFTTETQSAQRNQKQKAHKPMQASK
jgi:hypothetical protein